MYQNQAGRARSAVAVSRVVRPQKHDQVVESGVMHAALRFVHSKRTSQEVTEPIALVSLQPITS